MARYIQCSCNNLIESDELMCNKCGKANPRMRSTMAAPAIAPFHSGWYRDIDLDPVYIKSRKQLLHETRRRGQVSLYAED